MANNSNIEVNMNRQKPEKSCNQNSDLGGEEQDKLAVKGKSRKYEETTAWGATSLRNSVTNAKLKLT